MGMVYVASYIDTQGGIYMYTCTKCINVPHEDAHFMTRLTSHRIKKPFRILFGRKHLRLRHTNIQNKFTYIRPEYRANYVLRGLSHHFISNLVG